MAGRVNGRPFLFLDASAIYVGSLSTHEMGLSVRPCMPHFARSDRRRSSPRIYPLDLYLPLSISHQDFDLTQRQCTDAIYCSDRHSIESRYYLLAHSGIALLLNSTTRKDHPNMDVTQSASRCYLSPYSTLSSGLDIQAVSSLNSTWSAFYQPPVSPKEVMAYLAPIMSSKIHSLFFVKERSPKYLILFNLSSFKPSRSPAVIQPSFRSLANTGINTEYL